MDKPKIVSIPIYGMFGGYSKSEKVSNPYSPETEAVLNMMFECAHNMEPEEAHEKADDILIEIIQGKHDLTAEQKQKIVELWEETPKWYA